MRQMATICAGYGQRFLRVSLFSVTIREATSTDERRMGKETKTIFPPSFPSTITARKKPSSFVLFLSDGFEAAAEGAFLVSERGEN